MKLVPWISIVLGAVAAPNPVGLDIFDDAFNSGEGLSRNLARAILLFAAGALVVFAVLEMGVRWWLRRRRVGAGNAAS
jgi:hypothetical protein